MAGSAPVALFVYDRPALVARTLACLRDARTERLYVFSDGPRGRDDEPRVHAVRQHVAALAWTRPTVVERERNLGLSASIRQGISHVLADHDRVVVVEDDVLVAPEFLAFVERCLDHYEADERVAGVTGLRMPFDRGGFVEYPYDAFVVPRFFSWGWATWRRAWETFEFDRHELRRRLREAGPRPERIGYDLAALIEAAVEQGKLGGAWDVYCAASMLVNDQVFVAPTWNLVENAGLSSGTHFTGKAGWDLRWERELGPAGELRLPPVAVDETIWQAWLAWASPPAPLARRLVPRPVKSALRRLMAR